MPAGAGTKVDLTTAYSDTNGEFAALLSDLHGRFHPGESVTASPGARLDRARGLRPSGWVRSAIGIWSR